MTATALAIAVQTAAVEPRLARLIVPLDTSATAEAVLPWAALVARDHAMELHLVTVWNPEEPLPGIGPSSTEEDALGELRTYLSDAAQKLSAAGIRVSTEACVGSVAAEVERIAAERNGSMVMLCSHGEQGSREAYLGSVTERLLRSLHVPVLVIPAHR